MLKRNKSQFIGLKKNEAFVETNQKSFRLKENLIFNNQKIKNESGNDDSELFLKVTNFFINIRLIYVFRK